MPDLKTDRTLRGQLTNGVSEKFTFTANDEQTAPQHLAEKITDGLSNTEVRQSLTDLLTVAISALQDNDTSRLAEIVSGHIRDIQENTVACWYERGFHDNSDIEQVFRDAMHLAPVASQEYTPIYSDEEIEAF